jgi:hypothetical protein
MTKFTEERLRFLAKDYDGPRIVKDLAAEVLKLRVENEKLRAAICWIEPPFIDANTPESELRKRIDFCVQDAKRAALKGGEI